ncbi:MAG: asparaginase [Sulfuritalea sp.]|nr:asparaginase [Sulfuritalea sp.]MDP1981816.1 asparaginase [Sulfuritalea sp.]
MKHKICLIYTGGTIGMIRELSADGSQVLRPAGNPEEFLRYLKAEEEAKKIAEIDLVPLMDKDSTNMVPSDWTKIAHAVYERRDQGYQGFVIAHGTDTMHFSASALAFAFGANLNFPIVFTGAQTTPDIAHGDARINLLRSLKVACEDLAEVVVSFGDYIFRGCRVQKKDERRFDAFESPAEFQLGYITEDIVLSSFVRRRTAATGEIDFQPNFGNGIVQFSLIPGLKPKMLLPILEGAQCKGVVLQSFGAGNVPNEGEYSFREFIECGRELNKPIVIASQFPANSTLESHYQPGVEAVKAGAIPTGNMTNAAATVKFRWVLYQVEAAIQNGTLAESDKLLRIREMMDTSYVGEVTVTKSQQH